LPVDTRAAAKDHDIQRYRPRTGLLARFVYLNMVGAPIALLWMHSSNSHFA
jgi:hypothetical protein